MTTFQATCEFCDKTFISPTGIKKHLKHKICRGGNTPGCVNRAESYKAQRESLPKFKCPCGGDFKNQTYYDRHIKICKGTDQLVPLTQADFIKSTSKEYYLRCKAEGKVKRSNYINDALTEEERERRREAKKIYMKAYHLRNKHKKKPKKDEPPCDEREEGPPSTPAEPPTGLCRCD